MVAADQAAAPGGLEAERFLQGTLDALSIHIAILDERGLIVKVNQAWNSFAERNGFPGSHGLGANYLQICRAAAGLASEGALEAAAGIGEVMAGRCPEFRLEYPCHSAQEQRWFSLRATRFEVDGRIWVVVAHENITGRKLAEFATRRLTYAVEQSPVSIVITDRTGSVEYVNSKFCMVTGYSWEEVRGQNLRLLKSGETPAETYQQMWAAITAGQEWHGEFQNLKKNGEVYWEFASISAIRDDAGNITHFMGVKEDITERKRAAQQLSQLEESEQRARRALAHEQELNLIKSRFVNLVSHEFRTPLSVISGAAQLLTQYFDQMTVEEHRQQLQEIELATGRMTQMMNDLLLFGRLEAGKMEFCPSPVNLEMLCRQIVLDISKPRAASSRIDVAIDPVARAAFLDRKIFEHVLSNLLSNAVKYSPDQRPVALALRRVDSQVPPADTPEPRAAVYLEMKVSDSGIGIPAGDLAKLFQAFHRAANVGNRPGTGMGLTIIKQFIDLHRGSICLQSQEGQGTTVTVWLPISPPSGAGR
jgi:PAS domain S-box-containing protein